MSVRMQAWGNCAQASRIPVIPLPARSTFGVASVAPRLVTLSNSISFSHASQRVYILTKEHCSSWLNINIVPEAENGPRLAGFSGVLSPPPLCVCRRPLPPVNTNGCRHKSRIFARCCIVKSFHGMRSRWRSFLIPLFSHDDE